MANGSKLEASGGKERWMSCTCTVVHYTHGTSSIYTFRRGFLSANGRRSRNNTSSTLIDERAAISATCGSVAQAWRAAFNWDRGLQDASCAFQQRFTQLLRNTLWWSSTKRARGRKSVVGMPSHDVTGSPSMKTLEHCPSHIHAKLKMASSRVGVLTNNSVSSAFR